MRVLYALLCEEAVARQDGRLDVHGVFHQLYAPGFPAQQDRMVLAVAIEWDAEETGRKEFRMDLMDPADSPSLTINGHTEIARPTPDGSHPQTRLVMPLEGIVFPAEGTYDFVLHLDGEVIPLAPIHLLANPDA